MKVNVHMKAVCLVGPFPFLCQMLCMPRVGTMSSKRESSHGQTEDKATCARCTEAFPASDHCGPGQATHGL